MNILRTGKSSPSIPKFLNESGFTLLEVLVALLIMALGLTAISYFAVTSRQKLDQVMETMERATRFASDEATLRNSLVRVHLFLDKTPQEYALEYGPNDTFILPTSGTENIEEMSLKERDEYEKKVKKVNQKFNRIKEFQEKNKVVSEDLRIVGIGRINQKKITSEFESSLYIYTSGEKDHVILFFASDSELASLEILPFAMEFKRTYTKIEFEGEDQEETNEHVLKMAQEQFEKWKREK